MHEESRKLSAQEGEAMTDLLDIATDILAVIGLLAIALAMSYLGAWLENRETLRRLREPRRKMRVVRGGRDA